jgi:hypothetical protein
MASMGLPTSLRACTAESNGDDYQVGERAGIFQLRADTSLHTLFMCVLWCDQVWSADPSHMTQSLGLHE